MLIAVYKVFIGLLLAAFVGLGIAAFAPEPKHPEPPAAVMAPGLAGQLSPDAQTEVEQYKAAVREYEAVMGIYNRNVSAVAAVGAIAMLALGVTVLRRIGLFSDAFLLGGVVTFAYSVLRGFGAEDDMFRFIVVAIGLAIALALGYVRFVPARLTPASA